MSEFVMRFEDQARETWNDAIRKVTRYRSTAGLTILVLLFLLVVGWPWIVITVPAGHAAIRWWRFYGGTDVSHVYSEGSHLCFPWDSMPIYDTRIQTLSGTFDVLTSDGMLMTVDVATRFRLNTASIGLLHKNVGPDYIDTLVRPALGTYVRAVVSQYSAENAYGVDRMVIQGQIDAAMAADLAPRVAPGLAAAAPWISVQDVLIRSMKFPAPVEDAINRKIEQFQVKKEYAYRLERERLESERKQVEAEGIARFQQIVGSGISQNYLRWKGIEATLALAQSPNSKIVVIGTPRDGMPLILGGLDDPATKASKQAPSAGSAEAKPKSPDR